MKRSEATTEPPKVVRTPSALTFWLQNVLRATTACNFSSLVWPAGSAPAALASLLFDPPEPQIIGKHSESRLSYLSAPLHLLSSDSFSSTLLSSNLSLLCASSLLCFSSVHIVGSLTSKLPSIITYIVYTHTYIRNYTHIDLKPPSSRVLIWVVKLPSYQGVAGLSSEWTAYVKVLWRARRYSGLRSWGGWTHLWISAGWSIRRVHVTRRERVNSSG